MIFCKFNHKFISYTNAYSGGRVRYRYGVAFNIRSQQIISRFTLLRNNLSCAPIRRNPVHQIAITTEYKCLILSENTILSVH